MNLPFQPGQIVSEGGVTLVCQEVSMDQARPEYVYDSCCEIAAAFYGPTKFRVVLEGYLGGHEPNAATGGLFQPNFGANGAPVVSVDPEQIKESFGRTERKLSL